MKTRTWLAGLAAVALFAGATLLARGEVRPNPYQSIIDRNAFGLKPPPPPPDPAASLPPPTPPSNVKLTGIHSMFGPKSKCAMLEILETGPGKLPKKPTLKEGEREGPVEVVSINVEKGFVKILNNGVEAVISLTNDVAKATPLPASPVAPGMPAHLPAMQSVNPGFPPPPPPSGGNVAVPLTGGPADSGRSKVAVSSGGTTTSGGSYPGAVPGGVMSSGATSSGAVQPANTFSGVNVSAGSSTPAANPAYNNIPSRNLRVPTTTATSTDGSAPARPQYTREQIELLIEAQRLKNPGLPYPPTSINPNPGTVP